MKSVVFEIELGRTITFVKTGWRIHEDETLTFISHWLEFAVHLHVFYVAASPARVILIDNEVSAIPL